MKLFMKILASFLICGSAWGTVNHNAILSINTASTSITTGAYVQLTASIVKTSSRLLIVNGSSSIIKVAYGASGSETDIVAVGASGQIYIDLQSINIASAGTRIALEAVDATASSGWIVVSLLP